jgi:ribose 5-phosphate isomerase RpiB
MRVGIATDHGGFGLKEELITRLGAAGHEVVDFGASAPLKALLTEYGFTVDKVVAAARLQLAGERTQA